jgi:hypothetical protein
MFEATHLNAIIILAQESLGNSALGKLNLSPEAQLLLVDIVLKAEGQLKALSLIETLPPEGKD